MNSFLELIKKNRSYRRFFEDEKISLETLAELVEYARLSPSARNAQPLKYILSSTAEKNNKIFSLLAWAGYIKDWGGPKEGERPSAYIIQLHDKSIADNIFCDDGIAIQSIMLGATEKGLGGCIIASVNREKLVAELNIPDHLSVLYVLALGKPKETVKLTDIDSGGDYKYWRNENMVHHVPKRSIDDLIVARY